MRTLTIVYATVRAFALRRPNYEIVEYEDGSRYINDLRLSLDAALAKIMPVAEAPKPTVEATILQFPTVPKKFETPDGQMVITPQFDAGLRERRRAAMNHSSQRRNVATSVARYWRA